MKSRQLGVRDRITGMLIHVSVQRVLPVSFVADDTARIQVALSQLQAAGVSALVGPVAENGPLRFMEVTVRETVPAVLRDSEDQVVVSRRAVEQCRQWHLLGELLGDVVTIGRHEPVVSVTECPPTVHVSLDGSCVVRANCAVSVIIERGGVVLHHSLAAVDAALHASPAVLRAVEA